MKSSRGWNGTRLLFIQTLENVRQWRQSAPNVSGLLNHKVIKIGHKSFARRLNDSRCDEVFSVMKILSLSEEFSIASYSWNVKILWFPSKHETELCNVVGTDFPQAFPPVKSFEDLITRIYGAINVRRSGSIADLRPRISMVIKWKVFCCPPFSSALISKTFRQVICVTVAVDCAIVIITNERIVCTLHDELLMNEARLNLHHKPSNFSSDFRKSFHEKSCLGENHFVFFIIHSRMNELVSGCK